MATRIDYVNSIKNVDMDTIYLTGAGYVDYPFKGVSRDSALGWDEPVWGSELNRGLNLVMDNIDSVDYGMVARCEISFKYMNVKDYKVLCEISKQRVCTANFFNRETGQRVTQEMAFTGNEIAKLYKLGTQYLGVFDVGIKLVATNRDRINTISATHTVSYNANGGSGSISSESVKWAGQTTLASSGMTKTGSTLLGWSTIPGGYGEEYKLGQPVTVFGNLTLYAEWSDSTTLKTGSTLNYIINNNEPFVGNKLPDQIIEEIYIDYYTGQDEYIVNGVNQIEGISSFDYADLNNKVKMYRSLDKKKLFILADKNCTIYANTDSKKIFMQLEKLRSIKFPALDFSMATDLSLMFSGDKSLVTIIPTMINTENATDLTQMFTQCESLKETPKFITDNVDSFMYLYSSCYSLKSLDLSFMNTESAIYMDCIFEDCSNLEQVNLSSFNTNNVTSMDAMFVNCSKLKELNLSSFNKEVNVGIGQMFYGCTNLRAIYVDSSKWKTPSYDGFRTFEGCVSIVGGNGTQYDSNHIGAGYARVDAPGTPGYLTESV